MPTPAPEPIIIDTDPGIDDAFAILYASYAPEIELVGLTSVFGNVCLEQTTRNAGYLTTLMPSPVPVAKGAEKPLVKQIDGYAEFVHGDYGFGDHQRPPPEDFAPVSQSAAEFIVAQINARPGEITLVPIGPLTNIADALALDPSIAQKTKRVVLMGGCVHEPGNVSPVAEANIWNDPHAAEAVFTADWDVVMIGLDITHQLQLHTDVTQHYAEASPRNGQFLHDIASFYQRFYESKGFNGFAVHDPTAMVYVAHPEYFSGPRGQIDLLVEGIANGQTLFSPESGHYHDAFWQQRKNVIVPLEIKREAILQELSSIFATMP